MCSISDLLEYRDFDPCSHGPTTQERTSPQTASCTDTRKLTRYSSTFQWQKCRIFDVGPRLLLLTSGVGPDLTITHRSVLRFIS